MDQSGTWKNYPTHALYMWLTSVEETYRCYRDMARDILRETGGDLDRATKIMGDRLKDSVEASNPLQDQTGYYADILTWACGVVDYWDVAGAILEDVARQGA